RQVLPMRPARTRPRAAATLAVAASVMRARTGSVPGETVLLAVVPSLAFLVILGGILVMLSGERLIIGERGILLGSVAPFLSPYVLHYDQLVPGTVVPISGGIRRYARQTGLSTMTTVRTSWWSERGISLVGPDPASARGRGRPGSGGTGFPWLIGTRAPAEQAAREIAQAAAAAGFVELARATAAAPPRVLSGDPRDAPQQLPGVAVMRRG